jgi:hypothetical protein
MTDETKNENASALSALGASKGGKARAGRLSQERRRQIATAGAIKRWGMEPVRATHSGSIKLGDAELACANLPDGRRVIAESTMLSALGRGYSGYYSKRDALVLPGTAVPPRYLSPAVLRPFIPKELNDLQLTPYLTPAGTLAKGVDAELVPMICEVWLTAREAGKLNEVQLRTAAKAEIILRGMARVGIIALIDEATGYQDQRPHDALVKILEAFIAKELRPYVKTFPPEFYQEIYRLRKWKYPRISNRRTPLLGHITNDIVYARLAPGVRRELHKKTPRNEKGKLVTKLFQWLTEEIGNPRLRDHNGKAVLLMNASEDWPEFMRLIDRALPKYPDLAGC